MTLEMTLEMTKDDSGDEDMTLEMARDDSGDDSGDYMRCLWR